MNNIKANKTKQILLFDDEQAAQEFVAEHNRGAAIPEYSIHKGLSFDDMGVAFETLQNEGYYMPLPDAELWQRAGRYHAKKVDQVSNYLSASGLTDEENKIVSTDYFNALRGNYNFAAPPAIMHSVLNKTQPYKVFLIDQYGLWQMFQQYADYCKMVYYYKGQIRDADGQTKTKFLKDTLGRDAKIRAWAWAYMNKHIRLLDFSGVPTEKLVEFTTFARKFAELYDYCSFYHVCKYAYIATPEELDTIRSPQGLTAENIVRQREAACENAEAAIKQAAEQYASIIDTETPQQEREQEREQAARWETKPAIYGLNQNLLSIQSRGVYGVPNGEIKGGILPIKTYIEKFLTENKVTLPVSPYQIEQAIDGVNIMALENQGVLPVNGYYTYHTNLSEFSRFCGLTDANQTTNKQLLQALQIIDFAAWLVVWRPKGPAAVRVLTITEIAENGDFTVNVTQEAMRGKPNLVTQQGYEKLRAETKGQPKAHFRNQVLSKGHKSEDELIKECWDYQLNLDVRIVPNNPEQTKKDQDEFLKEWKKRYSTRKKTLRGWFDEYAANEALVYTYYEKGTGRDKKGFYKWRKGTLLSPPKDLITDAEIVEDEQTVEQPKPKKRGRKPKKQ